jgi:hypothetical protein
MSQHAHAHDHTAFIPYPTNRVVGTITNPDEARAAVDGLVAAGFNEDSIDVLHGEKDLHRLDPTGLEHGLFAVMQRTLIRGAVGSEFRHLNHQVEDLRAGKCVVMVLARERKARDVAADILHLHGAEFVGFYGRWAYEALPGSYASHSAPPGKYDINIEQETIRIQIEPHATTVIGAAGTSKAIATSIGEGLVLVSWVNADNTVHVHVVDSSDGIVYTSVTPHAGPPRHSKSAIIPPSLFA